MNQSVNTPLNYVDDFDIENILKSGEHEEHKSNKIDEGGKDDSTMHRDDVTKDNEITLADVKPRTSNSILSPEPNYIVTFEQKKQIEFQIKSQNYENYLTSAALIKQKLNSKQFKFPSNGRRGAENMAVLLGRGFGGTSDFVKTTDLSISRPHTVKPDHTDDLKSERAA